RRLQRRTATRSNSRRQRLVRTGLDELDDNKHSCKSKKPRNPRLITIEYPRCESGKRIIDRVGCRDQNGEYRCFLQPALSPQLPAAKRGRKAFLAERALP